MILSRFPPLALFLFFILSLSYLSAENHLNTGFKNPPGEVAPWTWWHWIDSNVSKEGITKDLESMKEIGLGGMILFDVGMKMPSGEAKFMNKKWWEAIEHTMQEAERLDLSMGAFNCPGFSQSGGPWIKPEQAMKRLVFSAKEVSSLQAQIRLPKPKGNTYRDHVVVAFPSPKTETILSQWEHKSARTHLREHGSSVDLIKNAEIVPEPTEEGRIDPRKIVVLKDALSSNGILNWKIPSNEKWTVMRIGYAGTDKKIHPTVPSASGLECDKLSKEIVRYHLEQYIGKLHELGGEIAKDVFRYVQSESWECKEQDWTPGLGKKFEATKGYSIEPYMPLLLTGQVIGSVKESEAVLWDWRRFLADQIAEAYYGEIHRFCQENDLIHVGENTGRQQYLYDSVRYHRYTDIPMGEFWDNQKDVRVDNKHAASSAHTTGRNIVAAEAFTSPATFRIHPGSMKPMADQAFSIGVNFFIFHTFAHQPWPVDLGPGMTMGPWGHHFNRNNTWFKPGRAWIDYIRRCQFMLRQGRPVSDLLVFTGEDIPNLLGFRNNQVTPVPEGYDYDGCDWESLNEARVENGIIVLPSGTRYHLLVMPESPAVRLRVAQKIEELINEGAKVLSPKFTGSPSRSEFGEANASVLRIADQLFGYEKGSIKRRIGKGVVLSNMSIAEALASIELLPDMEVPEGVVYIHRRTNDEDIYFISNRSDKIVKGNAIMRVAGKQPEIWNAKTGETTIPAMYKVVNNRTHLPIYLDPYQSMFIVLRGEANPPVASGLINEEPLTGAIGEDAVDLVQIDGKTIAKVKQVGSYLITTQDGKEHEFTVDQMPDQLEINGHWKLSLPIRNQPDIETEIDRLTPLNNATDQLVKYFSGTAVYRTTFHLAHTPEKNVSYQLDLGQVGVIAEVKLNGQSFEPLWVAPFTVDVTEALIQGTNKLEIEVTTLWINRLIGDKELPKDVTWRRDFPKKWPNWLIEGKARKSGRQAFTTNRNYDKIRNPKMKNVKEMGEGLVDSGLIGPVTIRPTLHKIIE